MVPVGVIFRCPLPLLALLHLIRAWGASEEPTRHYLSVCKKHSLAWNSPTVFGNSQYFVIGPYSCGSHSVVSTIPWQPFCSQSNPLWQPFCSSTFCSATWYLFSQFQKGSQVEQDWGLFFKRWSKDIRLQIMYLFKTFLSPFPPN